MGVTAMKLADAVRSDRTLILLLAPDEHTVEMVRPYGLYDDDDGREQWLYGELRSGGDAIINAADVLTVELGEEIR